MPTFSYKAATRSGKIIEDIVESENQTKAIQKLQQFEYIILSIKEKKETFLSKLHLENHVPLLQKVIFFKHLASMLEAGLTISESIETLAEQMTNKNLQKILNTTNNNLKNGLALHFSFSKYSGVFSPDRKSVV